MHRSLCFISRLVVQFSMTYAVLAAQPDYYTAAFRVCQYLFENFLKFSFAQALTLTRISTRSCAALLV